MLDIIFICKKKKHLHKKWCNEIAWTFFYSRFIQQYGLKPERWGDMRNQLQNDRSKLWLYSKEKWKITKRFSVDTEALTGASHFSA